MRWTALGSLVAGCYTLQPVAGGPPEVGTRIAFDINDAGRAALGGSIGPEIGQVEGSLLGSENGEYAVAVSSVRFIRGGHQNWTGERVRIRSEYVDRSYERRFSRGRTIALSAAVVGAVTYVVLGTNLVGLGREPDGRPGPDPGPTELIPRRP